MTTLNAIRTLTIRSKAEGVQETTAALKGLQAAHDGVTRSATATATVTDMASKRQLSVAAAYQRQTLALDEAARSQDRIARATTTADRALRQGLITQADHERRITLINAKLSDATKATNDNNSAFDRLANTLSRRFIFGVIAAQAALAARSIFTLNSELAKTGDIANRIGAGGSATQGIQFAGQLKGVDPGQFLEAMLKFNQQVDEARNGIGSLGILFRANGVAVKDTEEAFFKVADLVKNANTEAAKFSILQQAGLPTSREFVRLMEQGADTIRRQGAESTKFTDIQLQRAKEIDDRWNELWANFTRSAKAAVLEVSEFPQQGTPLRFLMDWVKGDKKFEIKVDLSPQAGSILDVLQKQSGLGGPPGIKIGVNDKAGGDSASRGSALGPATVDPARLKELLTLEQQRMNLLGPAATEQEKYNLRLRELRVGATEAGLAENQLARATAALGAEFKLNQLREVVSALGAAATMSQQYALKQAELAQKVAQGAISQEVANRALKDFKQDQSLTFLRNNVTALGTAATASEQYELKVAELQQQLDRGQISQETFTRAIREASPAFQIMKTSAEQFGQSLASAMMNGKSLTEALNSSLKTLSSSLASGAIKSLINQDFASAALQGFGAIATGIASLFGGGKNEQVKQINALNDRIAQYMSARAAAAVALNPDDLAARLGQFEHEANLQRIAEERAGNQARAALEETLSVQRAQIVDEFNKSVIAKEKAAADERKRIADEIAHRQQSAQDRLLAATVDQTTLGGQLELFNRQAQREREAEVEAGGQAMVDLEAAQAAERFNLIKSFNDKIVDDAKRTAQEQLDAQTRAARAIVDYVSGLQTGPESALSPSARLTAAQSTYNSVLGLAQGGNSDALGRITQDFENLRKAAQSFYGSSSGYQNILNAGINQLLALPSVATSTDPVVAAIRDSITANNTVTAATTNAVQLDTTQTVNKFNEAIQKFADAVTYMSQAVNQLTTSNSLLDQLRALNTTSRDQLQLLTNQYTIPANVTPAGGTGVAPGAGVQLSNAMLGALNKIVYNTWATALNTRLGASFSAGTFVDRGQYGTYAKGGTVPPGGFGIFGEHHPDGPFFMRAGKNPVPITPSMPAANDNGSSLVVAAIQHQTMVIAGLLQRIEVLERRNVEATERGTAAQVDEAEIAAQQARLIARKKAA